MNLVVERALQALRDAGIGTQPQPETERKHQGRPAYDSPKFQAAIKPTDTQAAHGPEIGLPENVLLTRYPLAALCKLTLDSNPAAGKLSAVEKQWVAEHLERAVLNWLERIIQPEDVWEATCPRGHHVSQGIFVKCLLGWCCSKCQQVFPASECRWQPGRGGRTQ